MKAAQGAVKKQHSASYVFPERSERRGRVCEAALDMVSEDAPHRASKLGCEGDPLKGKERIRTRGKRAGRRIQAAKPGATVVLPEDAHSTAKQQETQPLLKHEETLVEGLGNYRAITEKLRGVINHANIQHHVGYATVSEMADRGEISLREALLMHLVMGM